MWFLRASIAVFVGTIWFFYGPRSIPQAIVLTAPNGYQFVIQPKSTQQNKTENPTIPIIKSDEFYYQAKPTISRDHYIRLYCQQQSAACPEAGAIYDYLLQEGFDPAVHAAQAMHETGLGTAGIGAPAYKNMHGVQCHAGDGRFADSPVPWGNGCAGVYASYLDSVKTWVKVLKTEYINEGRLTPEQVVVKYAPANADGNNPPAYIADMEQWIRTWRAEEQPTANDAPNRFPVAVRVVMTQGYGVGSHAPAEIWGAIDLAIDSDGDGQADPKGTLNSPVYATHGGKVQLAANTWPAGNHIWVIGPHFKTGYSHLNSFAVEDGKEVHAGDVIGYIGSTGQSSGPHLDYQVWKDGVNVNPLGYCKIGQ